jgi:hypothetical protein
MSRSLRLLAGLALALALPASSLADEPPGYFKVPGTDTTLKLYGYVELDGTYDISGRIGDIENYDWASIVPVQPLKNTPNAKETGKLYFTARTSRFGIQTSSPTSFGPLATKLEGDFNGPNGYQGQTYTNSVLFRLRHAYATLGGFLVGQTWTLFLDFPSSPETVDFNGPGSVALVRQPQVRYTFSPMEELTLAAALENSRNGGVGHVPDITAKAAYAAGWGTAGLAIMTNQYRYNQPGNSTPRSGTRQGYGLAFSGSYKIGPSDSVQGLLAGGDGIGRYLFNTAAGQFAGTASDGSVKLWRAWAYHLGYAHAWTPVLRSNLVWSQTFFGRNGIDRATFATADDEGSGTFVPNSRIDQLFVNAFYSLSKTAEVGLEYELGRRHTFDRQTGAEDRITASAHYNFF